MDLSNLLGSLLSEGQTINDISKKVGARPEEVQKAAKMSVPTLVEALNKNAEDEEKRASLNKALEDHSEDNVEDLQGFLNNIDLQDSQKMLGHILGGKKTQVESNISKSSGLSSGQVSSVLAMLAPILIGILGKKKKAENISKDKLPDLTGSLGNILGGGSGGGIMDMAKKILDKDQDGSIMDDLMGGFFGKK
jgi:hypothetical protein